MIPYPRISPTIVRLGPFEVRWYGLMYLLGFTASYLLFQLQVRRGRAGERMTRQTVESLYFWAVIALVTGARIGYVLFYNPGYYLENPLEVFAVWKGGMSFHGGLIGLVVAGVVFCRRHGIDFWFLTDLFVPTIPPGLGMGRLGNFINGELYGRPSGLPWAMVFPGGGEVPRHPSQLYEMFLEGVVLFAVLWYAKGRVRTRGLMLPMFLVCYGLFRFLVEFTREPDPQLGFVLGPFTMGQVLSSIMIMAGVAAAFTRFRPGGKA